MKFAPLLIVLLIAYLHAITVEEKASNYTGNIPFELIKEKIIIPVQIGDKTYRFLVDTGGILEISEELFNEYGFKESNSITITDINRIETELKTAIVPQIKLGNWAFKDRRAIVGNLHKRYPFSCFELDGMIGRDFFDEVILQFDYSQKTFRISEDINSVTVNKNDRTRLKLSSRGLPEARLSINGTDTFIEFDSGSGDFYSPRTADVEKRATSLTDIKVLKFQGEFSFGVSMDNIKPSNRYMEKVESFKIANTTFQNFYSQFSKESAPRIGAGILKYGKVTIDYKNGWFYYEPFVHQPDLESFRTFGFDVAIENKNYKVKWTLVDSDAHNKGLRSGSIIIAINDTRTQNIEEDCDGYLNGYTFQNEEKIQVTFINDQDQVQTINLTNRVYE